MALSRRRYRRVRQGTYIGSQAVSLGHNVVLGAADNVTIKVPDSVYGGCDGDLGVLRPLQLLPRRLTASSHQHTRTPAEAST